MVRISLPILFLTGAVLSAAPSFGATPLNPSIMGTSTIPAVARASFLNAMNPAVDLATALNYALLYDEEAEFEGVNPDLAFVQMLLETSFLRFGGQVKPGQNNFSGIGAIDGGEKGLSFPSPRVGVRAQVQHLKYYATNLPLAGPSVNPRLTLVRRASATTAWELAQSWASDPEYGKKLMALMARMVDHAQKLAERSAR